jgi:hypothetical protein
VALGLLRAAGQWYVLTKKEEEGLCRSRNLESNVGNKRGSVIGGSSFRNLDINLDCNYVALESFVS